MKQNLPLRPNLEQLRKQAKTLVREVQAQQPEAVTRVCGSHPRWADRQQALSGETSFTLSDAQFVIAREYGFASWDKLRAHVTQQQTDPPTEETVKALLHAAGSGDIAQLTSLLDAHPGVINETGGPGVRTALHQAVFGNQELTLSLLLERGANPNIRCEGDNAYPLHFAAEKQRFPIIRALIEYGADPVGEGDYHELGVLGWATAWEYIDADPEIVKYLLAHGARHNIFSAVAVGDEEEIRRLVAHAPESLERRMDLANRRRRPLHLAVVKKQIRSLMTLLKLGANPESLDEAGFSALDQAALIGETRIAQALLDRGAKVRLPAAFAFQKTRDIERLLRRDSEALRPGGRWSQLILRASERSPGTVIDALVQAGASVNIRDDPKTSVDSTFGYTPLHAAAFHGNLSAAAALLKHGANVQTRDEKYHGTPAGWASYAGHTELRDLILRAPVDIMEAVEYGLIGRIKTILAEDPGALDRSFEKYPLYPLYAESWHTPLAFAVAMGQADTVELLIARGADSALVSPHGYTLSAFARRKGHLRIADLLELEESRRKTSRRKQILS